MSSSIQSPQSPSKASPDYVNKTFMPYRLDEGVGQRAAIGLIALSSDQTIEHEWRRLLNLDGVAFFVNRIHNFPEVTPANLKKMEADLSKAAALIIPAVPLDVIAYGCTSAAMIIGEEAVARHIRTARRGNERVTTPITAAKVALKTLAIRRIALLTPYIEEINRTMRAYLEEAGFQVPVMGSFNNACDHEVMRISLESIQSAALELGLYPSVDAVFIACTSLRGAALVESLEARLHKPVITSCYALAWHALRLAGYTDPVVGQGTLFQL